MAAAVKLKDLPESDALAAIAAWLEQCEDHLALSRAMELPAPPFNLGEAWPMVLAIARPERLYLHHMNIRQRELHPETLELVASFARALALKLRAAEVKHGLGLEWKTDDWEAECRAALTKHVAKGDPLDVAAYAAFCWARGWTTAPPAEALERTDEAA
ncbi:hypothetical protein [Caulobacter sp. DWR3-1-2]|uniref:hypothetical protein n=1 Tax=Caulobacter sp. DWR3-1-2 TaxID=2804647 RepID=UPI003CF4AA3A